MSTEADDLLLFCDRAVREMGEILLTLGDQLANERPDLPGANSPYAILNHCLGVTEYWIGAVVLGRPDHRDRDAEFTATGPVAPLIERSREAMARLHDDVADLDLEVPVEGVPAKPWMAPDRPFTRRAALAHVLEELVQHHGHMELTRDILLARQVAN
jgi:uncharacterized damage-inducible protein DinB